MLTRNKVTVAIATFSLGTFMGLSTGMAGADPGPGNSHKAGGSKVCSPGQQGNPAPGFKPGGCKR